MRSRHGAVSRRCKAVWESPVSMLNWKRGRESVETDVVETSSEAHKRIGESLVELSEQFVAVYTRESASIDHLKSWCTTRPGGDAQRAVAEWLRGTDEYLVVAQPKGHGADCVCAATSLDSLLNDGLVAVGTSKHGLSKSLCRVLSARQDVMAAVGRAWVNLGGLSIAAELNRIK